MVAQKGLPDSTYVMNNTTSTIVHSGLSQTFAENKNTAVEKMSVDHLCGIVWGIFTASGPDQQASGHTVPHTMFEAKTPFFSLSLSLF